MDQQRKDWYNQIEKMRNSKVITYITGDKPGMETQISNEAIDYFIEHLEKIGIVPKITLILYTNGGSTLAGWNIVNLIRQFCEDFEVIVPTKARSTGTLMCLGANRIIMTKQATLGPIDPSINTALNPQISPLDHNSRFPVSVEAIKGFFELAKQELHIKDDHALASIFNTLAEKVHPLVLGEVYRAISQIQMLAEKLLAYQVTDGDKIKKIISFLCSESGSHDYTINRREAANNLGLNIEKPDDELYNLIKCVYNSIKEELSLIAPFEPNACLGKLETVNYNQRRVIIESTEGGKDVFVSEGILTRTSIHLPEGIQQPGINDHRLFEGWRHVTDE